MAVGVLRYGLLGIHVVLRPALLYGLLAPQVAVVTHAAALNAPLEDGRLHLLDAAQAERSRLRRDLHDGLGPSLSVCNHISALLLKLQVPDRTAPAQHCAAGRPTPTPSTPRPSTPRPSTPPTAVRALKGWTVPRR